jgi:hypothetical protein
MRIVRDDSSWLFKSRKKANGNKCARSTQRKPYAEASQHFKRAEVIKRVEGTSKRGIAKGHKGVQFV